MSGNSLHIDTDQVQTVSSLIIQVQDEIDQSAQCLLEDVKSADWISPGRDNFVAEMEALMEQICQTTEEGRELALKLKQEVLEWENVAQTIPNLGISGAGIVMIESGGGSFVPSTLTANMVTAIGSSVVVGPGLITGVASWIRLIFEKLFPDKRLPVMPFSPPGLNDGATQSQTPPVKAPTQPEEPPVAQAPVAPTEPTAEETTIYHDVPVQSQQGLDYNGKNTLYGCVPTSASMITNYWHQEDESNRTISAQDLIDNNVEQKEFNYRGMSTSNLEDDLEPLGYKVETHSGPVEGPDNETRAFKDALAKGPVIAVVRLNMNINSNDVHAVVITGISQEGNVRINDPWDGKVKDYSWNDFYKVWRSDFGKNKDGNQYPTRAFTTVVPIGR